MSTSSNIFLTSVSTIKAFPIPSPKVEIHNVVTLYSLLLKLLKIKQEKFCFIFFVDEFIRKRFLLEFNRRSVACQSFRYFKGFKKKI